MSDPTTAQALRILRTGLSAALHFAEIDGDGHHDIGKLHGALDVLERLEQVDQQNALLWSWIDRYDAETGFCPECDRDMWPPDDAIHASDCRIGLGLTARQS